MRSEALLDARERATGTRRAYPGYLATCVTDACIRAASVAMGPIDASSRHVATETDERPTTGRSCVRSSYRSTDLGSSHASFSFQCSKTALRSAVNRGGVGSSPAAGAPVCG